MNKKQLIAVWTMGILLLGGCVAPSAYIQSDIDSSFIFSKEKDKIFVSIFKEADIKTREFGKLLINEMKDAGFNIVDNFKEADVALAYILDQETSVMNSVLPIITPSTTSGSFSSSGNANIYGNNYSYGTTSTQGAYSQTTTQTQYIPYLYPYTVKKIYLSLYSKEDLRSETKKTIWECRLGVGEEDFNKYVKDCVVKLLNYYGKNFSGHVKLETKINKLNNPR